MSTRYDTNRNAVIRSRVLRNGNLRTETAGRDSGIDVSVTSNEKLGNTKFSVTTEDGLVVRLNGRQARTVFRVLSNHYGYTGKSFEPVL